MKKTLRMTALFLAMLMTLTAFVGVLPAYAVEPTNDAEAINAGYACKIVDANGNLVKYYKYFSPMDAVKVDENTTQSAYDYEKANNANVNDITTFNPYAAVQNVKNGETIVFLDSITLTTLSTLDFGTNSGKNNGYNTNVNAKGGYIISNGSKAFTIDGNGFSYNSLAGFIASNADVTVKNLKINMNGTESVGHARNGHTLTFDHCDITIGGVRAVGTNNAYFEFNTKTGIIDIRNTSISVADAITPVVPLFMSKTDNNTLKLHNVEATYPLTAIKAVNPGLSVTLSGNTSIQTAARTVDLQNGGTVVMNGNATLECTTKIADATANGAMDNTAAYNTYQAIYAISTDTENVQPFSLTMNDSSKLISGTTGVSVFKTGNYCSKSTITLNENASIAAYMSFRIQAAKADIFLNDASSIYTGGTTNATFNVAAANANCRVFVNSKATIGSASADRRVPFTYDTGISFIPGAEGLRFDSRIQADTSAVEFGTLIAKYDTVLGLVDFTHAELDAAGAKYLDVKATAANCLTFK
ncbi:MAG: hypothetical protein IJX19_12650, partial [Clostridia bacterium]|nr:hypothetical protein [Clostridia bacterium]